MEIIKLIITAGNVLDAERKEVHANSTALRLLVRFQQLECFCFSSLSLIEKHTKRY